MLSGKAEENTKKMLAEQSEEIREAIEAASQADMLEVQTGIAAIPLGVTMQNADGTEVLNVTTLIVEDGHVADSGDGIATFSATAPSGTTDV